MKINFKKNLLALTAFVLFFSSLYAQEGAHEKGKHYIGPGFGVYPGAIGVSVQYDYAIHKNWSVGGLFGFNGDSHLNLSSGSKFEGQILPFLSK